MPSKVKEHREKVRITKVIKSDWDEVFEGAKDFKQEDADWHHRFCRNEKGNSEIDRTGLNGFKFVKGTMDKAARKASVEFTRPFDVSAD